MKGVGRIVGDGNEVLGDRDDMSVGFVFLAVIWTVLVSGLGVILGYWLGVKDEGERKGKRGK